MTTFYFIGGEDLDFTKVGPCTVDTATTTDRRTAKARCSLQVGPSAAVSDGWVGTFDSSTGSFWFTARHAANSSGLQSMEWLCFTDGAVRRLLLKMGSFDSKLILVKRTATGTETTLATAPSTGVPSALTKVDVQVVYAVAGSVNVYLDGTLVLSYSGDVTTNSATALTGFTMGGISLSSAVQNHWSEVICASTDTRAMNLVTMAPAANGNTFSWDTGSYANVDETTIDDSDTITSATAAQLAEFTVSTSGISGTPAVLAVAISARGQKGGTGPQNAKMVVRTGGLDELSSLLAMPAAMGRFNYTFAQNPATSGNWAYSDLTAAGFNIGVRSET